MAWSVDPLDVVLGLLRPALTGVTVVSKVPDKIPAVVPLVVIRRTGGSSFAPAFYDEPYINVQCWAGPAGDIDQHRAAFNLADDVRRVLWTSWTSQTTTPYGHIAHLRESQGPEDTPDLDLPFIGRFMATYELRLRRPRT